MNLRKLSASLHIPVWIKSHARHKTLFSPMPPDSPCIQLTLSTYAHSFGPTHPCHPGMLLLHPPGVRYSRRSYVREETPPPFSLVAKLPLRQHSRAKTPSLLLYTYLQLAVAPWGWSDTGELSMKWGERSSEEGPRSCLFQGYVGSMGG